MGNSRAASLCGYSPPVIHDVSALNHNLGLNCCSNEVWKIGHLPNAAPPDAQCAGGYAFRQVSSFAGMDEMWNH